MIENLVIVESPAKARTIERFLGKEYTVKSSFGHIRDLAKKNLGIDIDQGFRPTYVIPPEKKKVVKELKDLVKKSGTVWLATDEDREGEAIAWHLYEELGLNKENTRRIVFHEITRDAIRDALQHPRFIDLDLVNAQQARRILDRLVGFELSPLLWKKVKPSLSAGRVQSVAVKLIVEKEREIQDFSPRKYFRVTALFSAPDGKEGSGHFRADLSKRFDTLEEARGFLEKCKKSIFTVKDVEMKPVTKSPAPPFTTSTLQQEASRKLGFSVNQTMSVAQRLYESGKITYMRTDSVNLSKLAIGTAAKKIRDTFGEKYLKSRNFTTRTKGAQEAHEAIRPTYMDHAEVEGSRPEQKLYELIWKRTIASQMSEAKLEKTTVTISISGAPENFVATGEVLKFDGFLKVYMESSDEDQEEESGGLLPRLKVSDTLAREEIEAMERSTNQPPRYTEASLVKKMEELGIGRPSTYAPTISTIQQREYVVKEDRRGRERDMHRVVLKNDTISQEMVREKYGFEKGKLFPTDIGMIVNDFLEQHFREIMNYNFTANVEKEFDEIAVGKANWPNMIRDFYDPFHSRVESTTVQSEKSKGEKLLGTDPGTGKPVTVKIGRYGPIAQIGDAGDEEKPRFASLRKGQSLETITLQEALDLFRLPRTLGNYENDEVVVGAGRYGPYIRHKSSFYSLGKEDDPYQVGLGRAVEIIEEKKLQEKNRTIKQFQEEPELQILNGRYGPYISFKKKNYRIPRSKNPSELTLEECRQLIEKADAKSNKGTS
ncbi:MAG TPA: type I DNA topoisomerase [Bacteroides sp.]|mgnify:CR=1 FL=1|nr:type I DNA topoisomerase [Bacteroides sp.]